MPCGRPPALCWRCSRRCCSRNLVARAAILLAHVRALPGRRIGWAGGGALGQPRRPARQVVQSLCQHQHLSHLQGATQQGPFLANTPLAVTMGTAAAHRCAALQIMLGHSLTRPSPLHRDSSSHHLVPQQVAVEDPDLGQVGEACREQVSVAGAVPSMHGLPAHSPPA